MKLPPLNEDVLLVTEHYPSAYCCCDRAGYFITMTEDGRPVLGWGKKPAKAWKDAARIIRKAEQKKRGSKATRP